MALRTPIRPPESSRDKENLNPGDRYAQETFDNSARYDPNTKFNDDEEAAIARARRLNEEDDTSAALRASEASTANENADMQSEPPAEREAQPSRAPQSNGANWRSTVTPKKTPGASRGRLRAITDGLRGRGGVIGFIIALFLLVGLIGSLQSIQIPGLMDIINRFRGAAVEQIVDTTSKKIVQHILATNFGKKDGVVDYDTDSPFGRLLATEGLEQRFRDAGIEVRDAGSNGVTIVWRGQELGTGRTPGQIGNILDNAAPTARLGAANSISQAVSTSSWGKRFVANFASRTFGIRYGVDKSSEATEEERARDTRQKMLQNDYDKVVDIFMETLDCIMGGSCNHLDTDERDDPDRNREGESAEGADEESQQGQDAVRDEVRDAADELTEEAAEDAANGRRTSSNLISNLTTRIIGALGTKAIPFVGWADLVASLVVGIDQASRNGVIAQAPIYAKSVLSAYMSGTWSGIGDAIKDGQVEAGTVNAFAGQMDGAAGAMAFAYINGQGAVGEPLSPFERINETNPAGTLSGGLQTALDGVATGILLTNPLLYGTAYVWYYSIGWVLRTAGDVVSEGLMLAVCTELSVRSWISGLVLPDRFTFPDCNDFEQLMNELLTYVLPKLLPLLGLAIDPLVSGAKLFNVLDMGATVINNQFCRDELGCRRLNRGEAAAQQASALAHQQEQFQALPLHERLFSLDQHKSAINQLALALPIGTAPTVMNSLASIFTLPQKAFAMANPIASAQGSGPNCGEGAEVPESNTTLNATGVEYVNLYCNDEYGMTNEELNAPLNSAFFTGDECPETNENYTEANRCETDARVGEIMEASVTGDDGSGYGGGTQSGGLATGNARELAQELLDSDNVTIVPKYIGQVRDIADGNNSCPIDPRVLQVLVELSQDLSFTITSLNRQCTNTQAGAGRNSLHWQGKAADIVPTGEAIGWGQGQFGYRAKELLYEILPRLEYDEGLGAEVGQSGYGPSAPSGSGIIEVADPPNHLHFGVDKRL